MENESNANVLAQLAQAAVSPKEINGVPFAMVPRGYNVESLERLLKVPARKKGKLCMQDVDSFIRYVNAHGEKNRTIIMAGIEEFGGMFRGILDYHEEGGTLAGWGQHSVDYSCPKTIEWDRWARGNKCRMNQESFAQFIEDNILNIVKPTGAEMLEIAKTLQATKTCRFKSSKRLENGDAEIAYEKSTEARAGVGGNLQIPTEFDLALSPFIGSERYAVTARLRYRIEEGVLLFWYELVNPHLVIEDACKAVLEQIEKGTGIKVYRGAIHP